LPGGKGKNRFAAKTRRPQRNDEFREALINSEFPQHKDVLPYSMAVKPLNMKKKVKSHFTFFFALIIHG